MILNMKVFCLAIWFLAGLTHGQYYGRSSRRPTWSWSNWRYTTSSPAAEGGRRPSLRGQSDEPRQRVSVCPENKRFWSYELYYADLTSAPPSSRLKRQQTIKDCEDRNRRCERLARNGDCLTNPGFMLVYCQKSCGTCGGKNAAVALFAQEKRLKAQLASGYDPAARPARNSSESVNLALSFSLLHLLDVDESKQSFTAQGFLRLKWRDPRLVWDPSQYSEIVAVALNSGQIWVPGLTVVNTAVADNSFLLKGNPTPVMVKSDGLVVWTPRVQVTSLCDMDMLYFPVDSHKCSVVFGPWLQLDSSSVNMSIWNLDDDGDDDIQSQVPNRKWNVNTRLRSDMDYFNPCCSEPWPVIHVDFQISRNAPMLSTTVITPIVYVMVTLLLCFLFPVRSLLRLIIASGDCVILLFFLLHLSRITPEASSASPLIAQLTVSLIVESMLVMFVCGFLYHLSRKENMELSSFSGNLAVLKNLTSFAPKKTNRSGSIYNRLQEPKQDLVDMFLGDNEEALIDTRQNAIQNGGSESASKDAVNGHNQENGRIPSQQPKPETIDLVLLLNRTAFAILCLIFFVQTIVVCTL